MNAHRKPIPADTETALRERAGALRSATSRQPRSTPLDACLADARRHAEQFDFAPFSIKDLGRLYELTRQADFYWGHICNMPLCTEADSDGLPRLTSVGWFVQAEENRMAFLRDRCVSEIAQRVPADDKERDEILCVRIAHEMDCSGRIERLEAPDLLIEALKAWG